MNKKKLKDLEKRMDTMGEMMERLIKEIDNIESEKTQKDKDKERLLKKFNPERWNILKLPMVRQAFPKLIAKNIFGTHPMGLAPTIGKIDQKFGLKFEYNANPDKMRLKKLLGLILGAG